MARIKTERIRASTLSTFSNAPSVWSLVSLAFPLLKAKSLQTLQCELCIKILYTNIYFTELFNNPRRNGFK